jgi:hypothetical protein
LWCWHCCLYTMVYDLYVTHAGWPNTLCDQFATAIVQGEPTCGRVSQNAGLTTWLVSCGTWPGEAAIQSAAATLFALIIPTPRHCYKTTVTIAASHSTLCSRQTCCYRAQHPNNAPNGCHVPFTAGPAWSCGSFTAHHQRTEHMVFNSTLTQGKHAGWV